MCTALSAAARMSESLRLISYPNNPLLNAWWSTIAKQSDAKSKPVLLPGAAASRPLFCLSTLYMAPKIVSVTRFRELRVIAPTDQSSHPLGVCRLLKGAYELWRRIRFLRQIGHSSKQTWCFWNHSERLPSRNELLTGSTTDPPKRAGMFCLRKIWWLFEMFSVSCPNECNNFIKFLFLRKINKFCFKVQQRSSHLMHKKTGLRHEFEKLVGFFFLIDSVNTAYMKHQSQNMCVLYNCFVASFIGAKLRASRNSAINRIKIAVLEKGIAQSIISPLKNGRLHALWNKL